MKKLLCALILAVLPCIAQAQWGGLYTTKPGGDAPVVGASITTPCSTANAVLYNAATPCSANLTFAAATGQGIVMAAGTAASAVSALSLTQTWNYNTAAITGVKWTFTDTSSHANTLAFQILCGASGTTNCLSVSKAGAISAGAPNDTGLNIGFPSGGTSGYTYLGSSNSGALTTANATYFTNGTTTWTQGTTLNIQEATINMRPAGGIVSVFTSAGMSVNTVGGTKLVMGITVPTIASGGCTSPTVTNTNGTAYFTIDVGTSCSGSQPVVFTLPAATTGWHCYARNVTNGATSAPAQTGAISTTSVTITNFVRTTGVAGAWTDGDDVTVSCLGG